MNDFIGVSLHSVYLIPVAIRTAGLQKITGVCSVCQFSNSE